MYAYAYGVQPYIRRSYPRVSSPLSFAPDPIENFQSFAQRSIETPAHASAMSAAVAAPVLCEDDRGIPRSLPLLATLVEAEARRYAATAASRPAETSLVRAFRGGASPKVPIRAFLERIHLLTRSMPSTRGMVRIDGTSFVLAGIYLTRFVRSRVGGEAGILVEPATAHRLVAAAVFLGAKFGGHPPRRWTMVFEASSEGAIRAGEMPGLEDRFLRAIGFRLFVDSDGFDGFCKVLERGPRAPAPSGGGCACKKRQADAADGEEDERRRIRPRLPPPAVVSN
ncbi:hypothetical protein PAHAL_4G211000 [Panicum hallii]|uniref:Uncharacterized protein n=2 Tax=Panicum hallii TaxID=206008 RepID=A0A2S3HJG9_9POAL|nr:hypothetical protein PAHAL_4G211000 [Panicum hallii]PAN24368.1 hypothetical protein PAHAL_4G211000 [Panicum hallii]